jgi:hypothetical protein
MAVWIAALNVLIQNPQYHSKFESGAGSCACEFSATSCARPGDALDLLAIAAAASWKGHAGFGDCPACLFLKSFNEGAIAWNVCAPDIAPTPSAIRPRSLLRSFDAEISRSPRAPPLYVS